MSQHLHTESRREEVLVLLAVPSDVAREKRAERHHLQGVLAGVGQPRLGKAAPDALALPRPGDLGVREDDAPVLRDHVVRERYEVTIGELEAVSFLVAADGDGAEVGGHAADGLEVGCASSVRAIRSTYTSRL